MTAVSNVALVGLSAVMVSILALGAAQLSGRRLGAMLAIALAAWLALTGVLVSTGPLAERWPLLPLTAFLTFLLLSQTSAARELLAKIPQSWPIAAQTFRIGVELVFFVLHADGRAPAQITFEGHNFDILVGLSAPVMAWLVARGRASPKLVLGWNAVGLALLVNAIRVVATSAPGPLHGDWPGQPFVAIASWPVIWVPAFLVPLAASLHVLSVRQTLARLRRSTDISLALRD